MQSSSVFSRRATTLLAVAVIAGILLSIAAGAAAGGAVAYLALRDRPTDRTAPSAVSTNTGLSPALPLAGANSTGSAGTSPEEPVAQAAASLAPSVVTVVNHLHTSAGPFGFNAQGSQASGSGVVISEQGHIVTNAHVVEGAEKLEVTLSDGTTLPATLVGSDVYSDLAVLKIEAGAAPAAVLGDSDALLPGDTVIAIGSPLGDLTNTVTVGVVSAKDRNLETSSGFQMEGLLQTDAAINSGNSGGPLVSLQGEVVGINTLVVRGSGLSNASAEGLGFAIPSNTARTIAEQLIAKGQVTRPYLGIRWEWITPEVAAANRLGFSFGAYITAVSSGSPADDAGLRQTDVILGMDGTRFDEDSPFLNELLAHAPGDTIMLDVMRRDSEIQVQVTLSERATT
jgi:S1-C subfamily serine protease